MGDIIALALQIKIGVAGTVYLFMAGVVGYIAYKWAKKKFR